MAIITAQNVLADIQIVTAPGIITAAQSCNCSVISRTISCPSGYVVLDVAGNSPINPTSITQYSTVHSSLGYSIVCDGDAVRCGHPERKIVCAKVCN